ncbi:hypothetical protein TVAG_244220 [Trichomonas vaginalis G3]|uniref:DUF3447 domain-containing protein n=1 Tax=Trichomonas vaginalis (strain ATCC PRA-98 / G3) TaxID=412133 RepID=A2ES09_TRIV3|nr:proteasome regulatory particle assembly [Trichomonas vaginalis G3]EAY04521.1 hypothetical protein TVAG_244220 [Trichomonas vaginalis G3]KAI5508455.1 proteasome regulatory particle assembly [Trichomonas vaginalis G3]|eukprot:XP_001316744.1 hypothetical protein [Trichomonas vaginalis G3]
MKEKKRYGTFDKKYTLLELCCYHGAVDCFKFLRTTYDSTPNKACLRFSFLGRNKEILSECLKYEKPDDECMKYAIISHNIDFVTFLMNEHKMKINPYDCGLYKNLESFLVYYDQIHNYHKCIVHSAMFAIPSLLEYFVSHGGYINKSNQRGDTALHYAARFNSKEMAELLLSYGAYIDKMNNLEETPLHTSAIYNNMEVAEFFISHGASRWLS